MKQARVAFSHLIASILILVLIVIVVFTFSPMFKELKGKLGFGIDLTPGEIKTQNEARDFFNSVLNPMIKDCMGSEKNKCFCSNGEIAFPNGYTLNFKENENGFDLSLYNHLGGYLLKSSFENIIPLVVDISPRRFQESGFEINYLDESVVNFGEYSELIDLNHTFFRWNETILVISSDKYSKQWHMTGENLCSN
jgi:hypothetical protein